MGADDYMQAPRLTDRVRFSKSAMERETCLGSTVPSFSCQRFRFMQDQRAVRLLSLISLALTIIGQAADWPEFMGPARDQTSPETGLRETVPAPILWEKESGTGYSAPSVRGGLLVLHHRVDEQEIIEAMDAKSGEPKWKYAYGSRFRDPFGYNNGPRCTPLLTED